MLMGPSSPTFVIVIVIVGVFASTCVRRGQCMGVQPSNRDSMCSYNGVLTGDACRCDAAWFGTTCDRLTLMPAASSNLGTIYPGPNSHNMSSWGGTVSKGEDGKFHLLVSEMSHNCGLQTWQHNSWIRHAVSETVDGVYEPKEIVMGVFSHNAACMDARPSGGPACILLHVGSGSSSKPVQTNCSGGYTPTSLEAPTTTAFASEFRQTSFSSNWSVPVLQSFKSGSWNNVSLTFGADKSGSRQASFSNPSGWVDSDGTAWLNYVLRGDHSKQGRGAYGFGLAWAPHWQGPYIPVAPGPTGSERQVGYWDQPIISSGGTPQQNCEDSVLYRGPGGEFHMLFHYYGEGDDHGDHGGHAFAAADGLNWTFTKSHAWNLTVPFDSSISPAIYSLRQRPHIVLSEDGQLTHLITGVVFDQNRPYPTQCKRSTGMHGPCDRVWTSLQPLAT